MHIDAQKVGRRDLQDYRWLTQGLQMPIEANRGENYFCQKKMYRFDREKKQKPTETSEPQSKCRKLSERGDLGVMLLVRVDPRYTNAYSGNSFSKIFLPEKNVSIR
jgi:hypothetical protein